MIREKGTIYYNDAMMTDMFSLFLYLRYQIANFSIFLLYFENLKFQQILIN